MGKPCVVDPLLQHTKPLPSEQFKDKWKSEGDVEYECGRKELQGGREESKDFFGGRRVNDLDYIITILTDAHIACLLFVFNEISKVIHCAGNIQYKTFQMVSFQQNSCTLKC